MSELDNIEKQMAELQARRQKIIDDQRNSALEEVRKIVRQYGFTVADLRLGRASEKAIKGKKPVTFRDEATGKEWNGELRQKGRKPAWINARISDGTIEQYRVKH